MALDRVKFEVAGETYRTTHDGLAILQDNGEPFPYMPAEQRSIDPEFAETLLDEEAGRLARPSLIGVGYLGGTAVSAIAFEGMIMQPDEVYDAHRQPYVGRPFVGVTIVATEGPYRRQHHAEQLMHGVVGLAARCRIERVQAIAPVDDRVKAFNAKCGFVPVPFDTYRGDAHFYTANYAPQQAHAATDMQVTTEALKRLTRFTPR